ncbi:glycosyltransferase [Pseudorhodobacter antarcticus]|nr:glycosyltransferase [Pseudorhodobacter antarcticus]
MTAPLPPVAPLISVIVPIYNVAGYVTGCVNSLRAQRLVDFEVILVDDGSTDGSGAEALAACAGDARFRLISQENQGLSGARNTGLDAARGGFIAFVDSDDQVMPDYLWALWTALGETGADWVACGVQSVGPDGAGPAHSAIHGASDLDLMRLPQRFAFDAWPDVIRHFPSAWNKLYRASLIDGLRFEAGTWFEDHGFFLAAANRTDHLLHLPQALYVQTRGRAGQITGSDSDRVFEQFGVLDRMRALMDAGPVARTEAAVGFAQIASRLVFERSTALRDPARRARFAQASAAYLAERGLVYTVDWDAGIGRAWAIEMAGDVVVSVVVVGPPELVAVTRRALDAGHLPGHEVIVVLDRNLGVDAASGRFVMVLDAGDCPLPWAVLDAVEAMLRDASDLGLFGMRRLFAPGHVPAQDYHNGFMDMRLLPGGTPPKGPLAMTPELALTLAPDLSAKLFSRAFLRETGLRFGAETDAVAALVAALLAGRVTYFGGPGVEVDMTTPARRVPLSGLRFLARHRAGLARVPAAVGRRLPRGWGRRLYARALAEQVYFAAAPGRFARLGFLAFAAVGAVVAGYKVARIAGLDPAVGPRLAQVLDPVSVVLEKLHLRAPAPEHAAYVVKNVVYFPLGRRGIFRFRVNFAQAPNINLNFRAALDGHVLLHISIRLDEGVVVCNDQQPSGQWRAERVLAVPLVASGAVMTVEFAPPGARVLLDGVVIFDLTPRSVKHRGGYRDFDQIRVMDAETPLQTLEVIPQMPQAALVLDPRFVLRAAGGEALLVGDSALDLLPASGFGGGAAGVMAALPGRVWQDVGGDAPLVLTLQNGGVASRLTLTRDDMAGRISALLDAVPLRDDSGLAMTVLEHLRYGGLLARVSPRAVAAAVDLARFYDLAQFLQPPEAGDAAPEVAALGAPKPQNPNDAEIDMVLARLVQSQMGVAPTPPLDVFAQIPISAAAQSDVFLALTEHFCSQDQDFARFAALAEARGMLPFSPSPWVWPISRYVPFLFVQHQFEALEPQLWTLVDAMKNDSTQDLIATAPFAWIARQTLTQAALPPRHRDMIVYAFCDFVIAGASSYWSRGHCVELIRTAAHLLTHRQILPVYLQDAIGGMCVRAYGLQPQFWALLAPHMTDLPPDVQRAAAAFGAVQATDDPQARDIGIRVLRDLGCVNIVQFARELLGPARVALPPSGLLSAQQVLSVGHAPAEAALRHMAAPNCGAAGAGLSEFVARGMPSFYQYLNKAPLLHVQAAASRAVTTLLDRTDGATPAAIADFLALCDALAHAESQFIGFGLCHALLRGLPDGAAQPLLRDWFLQRLARFDAPRQRQIAQIPALRGVDLTLAQPMGARASSPDLPTPSPLFDTIVMVFSCKPYLNSRVPALRCGWLAQLRAMGIPYVFVIGDGPAGAATLDGDVLTLDAPDTYEGLPQKTLAAIRWAHAQTGFAHMLKMDDDCFVNAPLFFGNLSYRKFDYYGRMLDRRLGQMDRVWHREKSASARGKRDLDKSLEPSIYADGGSGYALSRYAMGQAIAAADSPEGRQLIAASFMEDKMLGDLLAMRGVQVVEEDYYVSIRRRTHGAAIPVALWRNSFYPSQTAPIVQVHMDTHLGQPEAMARLDAPGLWPRKIWPSYQDVQLGYETNALELISSEASLLAARAADVAVVACMRNEMFMLPHFLAHYRKLGVTAFLIADNCSDDGTLEYLAEQPDVALFSVDTDYSKSHYGVAWQQAMIAAFRVGKWSLMADADELLVWQTTPTQSLPDLLAEADFVGADAVRVFMLDMYPQGPLETATFASGDPFGEAGFADSTPFITDMLSKGPFSDASSWTSALRHRLIPGSRRQLFVAQKLALLRYQPSLRLSAGLHYVGGATVAARELVFGHFKYNADFRRKAVAEVARGQHFNDAEEYRKYVALTSEGRSVLYAAGVSLPWAQVPFIKRLLR